MRRLCLVPFVLCLAAPAEGRYASATGQNKDKLVRPGKRTARPRSKPAARCRDIFCTTDVVRMDRAGSDDGRELNAEAVERLVETNTRLLQPCLVEARRRDPTIQHVRLEFAVAGHGQVLAARVEGKRTSPIARCLHRALSAIRFPRFARQRTVAAVTLAVPQ